MRCRPISRNLLLSAFSIGSAIALSAFIPVSAAKARLIDQPIAQPVCPGDQSIVTTTRIAEFPSLSAWYQPADVKGMHGRSVYVHQRRTLGRTESDSAF
ncbi:MAG: hypothetical protein AAF171_24950 [Cyanobacteria bacterium P01_A01_bin.116]